MRAPAFLIKTGAVILAALLAIVAAVFLYVLSDGAAYFYACHLESKWSKANPGTKLELEKHLHLYSEKIIDHKTSMWGHDHKMAGNERMV